MFVLASIFGALSCEKGPIPARFDGGTRSTEDDAAQVLADPAPTRELDEDASGLGNAHDGGWRDGLEISGNCAPGRVVRPLRKATSHLENCFIGLRKKGQVDFELDLDTSGAAKVRRGAFADEGLRLVQSCLWSELEAVKFASAPTPCELKVGVRYPPGAK